MAIPGANWNLDKAGRLEFTTAWMVLNQQAQVKKSSGMNIQRDSERKFLKYRRNLEKWERDECNI